jgi:hypothetical protein
MKGDHILILIIIALSAFILISISPSEPTDGCGDGICDDEPWPGENCFSCSLDCGECNSRIVEQTVTTDDYLSVDLHDGDWERGVHHAYFTGSGSWVGYIYDIELPYKIQPYFYSNLWALWVRLDSPTGNGRILNASANVKSLDGKIDVMLYGTEWSDVGKPVRVLSSDEDPFVVGFWSGGAYSQLLNTNGDYTINIHIWLEG